MIEFVRDVCSNWWGIVIITVLCIGFLTLLSALLYKQFFKRFYDVLLSGLAIILLSPVLIILTVTGAIVMKGNPFFVQRRPDKINQKNGKVKMVKLLKFRTMTNKKDADGNLLPDAERITKYGKILRSTSLDELPSLFNIFVGDLSLVGPRPQLIKDIIFMTDDQLQRYKVRAGLTGLAQINGRNNITWEQKFEYDLQYVNNFSFFGDIKILLLTVYKVLKRSDVEREGTVSDIDYGDWLLKENKITLEEYNEKLKEYEWYLHKTR